jgi:hypothetical protein
MAYADTSHIPDIDTIMKHGINCVGVINLARRFIGLQPPGFKDGVKWETYAGGTYSWWQHLKRRGWLEPLDVSASYPKGTLLLREYKDETDQGHVAIINKQSTETLSVLDSPIIHSYPDDLYDNKDPYKHIKPGLTIDASMRKTHYSWDTKGYFTHVCLRKHWLFSHPL